MRWLLGLGIWAAGLAAAYAQFGFGFRGDSNMPARYAPAVFPDRNFVVCRLMYTSVVREPSGGGWRTDYPYGEINLTIRLSELTRTPVSWHAGRRPNHYVVRATDDALFQCPFLLASDIGTVGLSDEEAVRLREYLLKGGFLWVDDFWGTPAWLRWTSELAKVLPPAEFPIEDVPLEDPIFRSQFIVTRVPQITNIGFWRAWGGRETSERGADSAEVHFRAVRDGRGRIMVLMTHNTDIADSWEREGEDPGFFYQFSPDGYAVGINVLLHAMTH
ncbi:MAG TPA: DUF4159 domain-containing protein [Vicinamibacterales bacterium]|nr:DUF4159 domain-containing protein [Vicinamibacterales bacterium]